MAWNDGHSTEWNQMATRRIRPTYVPPHLRPDGFPDHTTTSYAFTQYGFRPNLSGPTRPVRVGPTRGRGGGRGRGQWAGRQREAVAVAVAVEPSRKPIEDLTDVAEKFDELEVIEEAVTTDQGSGINFDAYEDIPVEVSGEDIPQPVNTFADIELGEALDRNIRRCKYVKPTPVQRHAIPVAVAGRDLMACAQTGSGKTAAFCFPIISRILKNRVSQPVEDRDGGIAYPSALILSPTRELTCQIHDEAKKFALQTGIKVVVAYGGAPISHQLRNLEKGVDILVATPGRLVDMIERERVSLTMIRYLALDEADRMLDMGFEPQIRKIVQQMDMPPPGQRQTLLFSATFPEEIQKLASDFLSNYVFLAVGRVGSSTELIAQRVDFVQDMDKRSHLLDILNSQRANGSHGKHALTLVFVETKKGADALEHWLFTRGFPATAIHGDKVQMERERALRSFKSGNTPIMVATDVASRGLDIPDVAHVINFDMPKDIDDYVHRIGRTGRAGKSGVATAFFNDKNLSLAKGLVELMREANQEIPPWLSEHAETSFASGGRSAYHRGSSKFGGYDYRSGSQFGSENNYQSRLSADAGPYHGLNSAGNYYGDTDYNAEPSGYQYSTRSAGYYGDSTVTDFNAPYPYAPSGPQGYVFGHESVIASGWE